MSRPIQLRRTVAIAFAAASLATATSAQTVDSTADSSRAESQTQYATLNDVLGVQADLENYKFQDGRTYEWNTATSGRPLAVSGVIQERVTWSEARQAGYKNHWNFSVPTALVGFTGTLKKDFEQGRNLNYAFRFNASPANGAAPLSLLDAQISYNVRRNLAAEDEQLVATFGQQQLPFGLEPQTSDEFRPTMAPAQWVGGLGLGARQIGLVVRGDFFPQVDYGYNYRAPVVQYVLGVFNGNGANIADDNGAKDLLGRLVLTAPADYHSWLRELAVGGTYYRQWFNFTATTPATPATILRLRDSAGNLQSVTTKAAVPGVSTIVGLGDRERFGFDIYYNHHPFGINYEAAYGIEDTLRAGVTTTQWAEAHAHRGQIEKLGHTVTFFFNWGEQFLKGYRAQGSYDDWWPLSVQPFLRWDTWDPNIEVDDNEIDVYTAGVNVFFARTTKLQLNANRTLNRNLHGDKRTIYAVLAQVQYAF